MYRKAKRPTPRRSETERVDLPGSEKGSERGGNPMRRLVFETPLLLGLLLSPLPVHAQGSVTLTACNAGKVDIDVFLSRAGKVSNWHIGAADCAAVVETPGAMEPAYVGFAFTDSKGQ